MRQKRKNEMQIDEKNHIYGNDEYLKTKDRDWNTQRGEAKYLLETTGLAKHVIKDDDILNHIT
jgi:hypothetical protein